MAYSKIAKCYCAKMISILSILGNSDYRSEFQNQFVFYDYNSIRPFQLLEILMRRNL